MHSVDSATCSQLITTQNNNTIDNNSNSINKSMSFQDVGRTTKKRQPNRGGFGSAPSSGNRGETGGTAAVANTNGSSNSSNTGYEQLSDLIVQYQVRMFELRSY